MNEYNSSQATSNIIAVATNKRKSIRILFERFYPSSFQISPQIPFSLKLTWFLRSSRASHVCIKIDGLALFCCTSNLSVYQWWNPRYFDEIRWFFIPTIFIASSQAWNHFHLVAKTNCCSMGKCNIKVHFQRKLNNIRRRNITRK